MLALDGDIENVAKKIPSQEVFEVGENIIITVEEVQLYQKFIDLNKEDCTDFTAEEYARQRNALYVEAIKNGYDVTEDELTIYLEDLRQQLIEVLSDEVYKNIYLAYGTEEEYWEFERAVYRIDLPIEKYVNNLEKNFKNSKNSSYTAAELEKMWVEEFNSIKNQAVEKQQFK